MTVIAYRYGVIAGDTRVVVDENVRLDETKVATHKGYIYGISGDNCPALDGFRRWFFTDLDSKSRAPMKGFKFTAMVVTPSGEIQEWDERGEYSKVSLPFYAIGSGREFALGAMEAGADSVAAVRVAIKWCPTVGGKVRTRKLKPC